RVRQDFAALQSAFAQHCTELTTAHEQERWRDIENVLQIPPLKQVLEMRSLLLANSLQIGVRLQPADGIAPDRRRDPASLWSDALEKAQRQGRMAAAVLGETWLGAAESDHLKQAIDRAQGEDWAAAFVEPGRTVSAAWQRLAGTFIQQLRKSGRAP